MPVSAQYLTGVLPQLRLIFRVRFRTFRNYIFDKRREQVLRLVTALCIIALFLFGGYFLLYKVFSYLKGVEEIGVLLVDKIMSIAFLAFFNLLVISNIITAVSTLFKSKETQWLLCQPIDLRAIFLVKLGDNLFYSTWALLLIGVPAIAAYGTVHAIPLAAYPILIFGVFLPFLVIPAGIGAGLTLLLYLFSRRFSLRWLLLGLAIIAVCGAWLYFKLSTPSSLVYGMRGDIRVLNNYLAGLSASSSLWLPNVWVSEALQAARLGKLADVWFYAGMTFSTAWGMLVLLLAFAERFYLKSYQASIEGTANRPQISVGRDRHLERLVRILALPFPKDLRALVVKDIKLFFRDPNQWTQFAILLSLLLVYLFNLRFIPRGATEQFWITLYSFVNFAFSGYILATLAVRFVYPTISLEGPAFWAILSSPVSIRRLFWEKFWVAFGVFFVIAETVAILSNLMLDIHGMMMWLTFLGILVMSIGLTCLAIGMGAIFPVYQERNPGRIASSSGGMLTIVFSLTYVALMCILVAYPTYYFMMYLKLHWAYPGLEIAVSAAGIVVLNVLTIWLPLRLGVRALERHTFH